MFKTYQDFVKLACFTYKLTYKEADFFIRQRLDYFCLKPRIIVCYINWAGIKEYSYRKIGKCLKISRQAVLRDLLKLQQVWPHLFEFGPPIPKIQDMSELPEDFDEYLEKGYDVEKF